MVYRKPGLPNNIKFITFHRLDIRNLAEEMVAPFTARHVHKSSGS
jgi:hypothetical protein